MRKSFLKRLVLSFIAASMLTLSGCAQKPLPKEYTPWTTYLGNNARASFSPDPVSPPFAVRWERDISAFRIINVFPNEQLASPIIGADGKLYASSSSEKLYSMDLGTGKVSWKFDADYPLEAAPVVFGDRVLFGSGDGILRCMDKSGKELWRFQARSEILSSPAVAGGTVYFSSSDDRVYALSLGTGEKLWGYSRPSYRIVTPRIYASPAYSEGRLFHFFSDGWVAGISAENGKELWSKKIVKSFEDPANRRRTVLLDSGLVYTIDDNSAVVALSQENGETKGIYNIIKATDFLLAGKRNIVISGTDQVVALDRITGEILWKREIKLNPVSALFASGDRLFVLSNYKRGLWGSTWFEKTHGYVLALDMKDGGEVWGEKLPSGISANGSPAGGMVALLTDKGILRLYENK